MNAETEIKCEYGSFRDPSGTVLYLGDEVYRRIDGKTAEVIEALDRLELIDELSQRQLIVATELLPSNDLVATRLGEGYAGCRILRHARIPFISYPYEWTQGMLADAARLHLDLQIQLVEKGFALKDASAYNVQFRNGRPVFIDIPSIEEPARLDVWVAYAQFCRMFLFPLMLKRYRGLDLKGVYLGNLDGVGIAQVHQVLGGWRTMLRPSLFVDVFLQHLMSRYSASTGQRKERLIMQEKRGSAFAQLANLSRLKRQVSRLAEARKPHGLWVGYENRNSYSSEAEAGKMVFVCDFLKTHHPVSVLDAGANQGLYSLAAAEHGCRTVALDSDPDCVDAIYRRARQKGADILPLWMDLGNPSPGCGFRGRERKAFLERADFEAVFALALMHHLLVTSRIPLDAIRDFFADLTKRWLVIEFVDVEDCMFQALLALRENIYGHITREHFESVFSKRFRLDRRVELPDVKRTLYVMEKLTKPLDREGEIRAND